ncbi:MAG: hypothetical protein R3250_05095 [Melioribacteraceae bacterium]|nr:hypothetical protein [Melioribacteraceae bacterium]
MKKEKKPNKAFYLILILIPILFFVILELALRLFNYGVDTSTWIKITDTHYALNPKVASKYFSTVKNVPESIQDVFAIDKNENSYRIFILGGSSAAGFPYMPLGAFSRYIRQRLEHNYPNKEIEVVNLGLSAVNSYTILDLLPDVLDEQPDLILIYAGHNEYYGALGVGSMESLGRSRALVNFAIKLNNYKTTQLLRDFLKYIGKVISGDQPSAKGTLMARMAKNQSIELNSEIYRLGLSQFRENMLDVIKLINEKRVPLIISTLVSNLRDQAPFIPGNEKENAKIVFDKGTNEYSNSNYEEADSLFRLAKDLDQLRFRAPSDINLLIEQMCDSLNIPIVQSDSILSSSSPNGIIGDNLMSDHLHLNLAGYQDLGEIFYDKMNEMNLLPEGMPIYNYSIQDSITREKYHFTELDSTISYYKITMLKNDWPFIDPRRKKKTDQLFELKNKIDSMAYDYVIGNEEWEKTHRLLAATYIEKDQFDKGRKHVDLLIHQYPLIVEYYKFISNELLNRQRFETAMDYLERGNNLNSNDFFNKWLGIINLSNNKIDTSIFYLERSLQYNAKDPQVLYNLSGAYSQKKNFKKAFEIIQQCLRINPDYKAAIALRDQLESIVK